MTHILILLGFYIVPLISLWKWTHIAYSKGGRLSKSEPDINDFMVTILPIANIVGNLIAWVKFPPKRVPPITDEQYITPATFFTKFFKIK